jgi:hypothetical protein
MGEQVIRFAITDGCNNRAATWRCWTDSGKGKSDFYLSCREIASELKVSFHETGIWRIAYTEEMWLKPDSFANRPNDRAFIKRNRPAPIFPGLTLALRIVTPAAAVSMLIDSSLKDYISIPIPSLDKAIEIIIFISTEESIGSNWPGKRSMNTFLIGSFLLANGETVCLVYRVTDIPSHPDSLKGSANLLHGKSLADLKGCKIRAHVFFDNPDGSLGIYDTDIVSK